MLAFDLHPTFSHESPFARTLDALLAAPSVYPCRIARCGAMPHLARHPTGHVIEEQDGYKVTVQAPGVKADDLSISFEHDVLTVTSATKTDRATVTFKQQAKLPNANARTATATHKDGVLTITLQKQPLPETIHIAVSDVLPPADEQPDLEDDEAPKTYTLTLAAAGVKASDIRIEASQTMLTAHGKTSGARGTFSIHRAYRLPNDADLAAATASHVDGILSVVVPTKLAPEATQIKISSTAAEEAEEVKAKISSTAAEALKTAEGDESASATSAQPEHPTPDDEKAATEEWLSEWDTMLDDLAEMGFDNRESSRAALAKHSGSIKRAVKELVMSRATK